MKTQHKYKVIFEWQTSSENIYRLFISRLNFIVYRYLYFTKENIRTLHLDSIKSNKVMIKNKKNKKHLTFDKLVV